MKATTPTPIVRILVRTQDNRFLLLRRAANDRWSPGKYEFPGGKVDTEDESLLNAAARELYEETGLQVVRERFNLFHVIEENNSQKSYVTMAYLIDIAEPRVIRLSSEHDKLLWVTPHELDELTLTHYTQELIQNTTNRGDTVVKSINDAKSATKIEHLIIYTDGGSRGNPGPSAAAYAILNSNEKVLEKGGEYLGITTNSQAEYQAVRIALEHAVAYHPQKVTFNIDSQLVVNQLNGKYQIKNRDLWPIHARIKVLMERFPKVSFIQVRREYNTIADAKVNEILDSRA